jgi:hypothetical protein
VEISSSGRKAKSSSNQSSLSNNVMSNADTNGLESAQMECREEFQMGNLIHFPEAEPVDGVPAEEPSDSGPIGTEYLDAVACLHAIVELSPRTAHRLMRKIVGVYRNLATIADGELE